MLSKILEKQIPKSSFSFGLSNVRTMSRIFFENFFFIRITTLVDGGIDSGSVKNLVGGRFCAFKSIWHEIAECTCTYYIQPLNSLYRYVHVP